MREMRYDLHEDPITGDWYLASDPKIVDPPPPSGFDFQAALEIDDGQRRGPRSTA